MNNIKQKIDGKYSYHRYFTIAWNRYSFDTNIIKKLTFEVFCKTPKIYKKYLLADEIQQIEYCRKLLKINEN